MNGTYQEYLRISRVVEQVKESDPISMRRMILKLLNAMCDKYQEDTCQE